MPVQFTSTNSRHTPKSCSFDRTNQSNFKSTPKKEGQKAKGLEDANGPTVISYVCPGQYQERN